MRSRTSRSAPTARWSSTTRRRAASAACRRWWTRRPARSSRRSSAVARRRRPARVQGRAPLARRALGGRQRVHQGARRATTSAPRTSAPGTRPCSAAVALLGVGAGRRLGDRPQAAITRAIKEVAHYLGNTPAVCRASYIDPRVFDAYDGGLVIGRPLRDAAEVERRAPIHHARSRRRARPDRRARALPAIERVRLSLASSGCGTGGRPAAARRVARPASAAPRVRRRRDRCDRRVRHDRLVRRDRVEGPPRRSAPVPYVYRRSSDERMIRETCICEQPTCSAISDCRRSSWKRRRRISCARSSRIPVIRSSMTPASTRSNSGSRRADQVAGAGRVALLLAHRGVERAHRRGPRWPGAPRRSPPASGRCARRGRRRSGPAELGPQLLARLLDHQAQLLEVARRPHVPGGVAEVAADLAEDRRHRVAREREPAVGVPAVDGLDEAHRGDLHEVVERLRGARGSAGRGCGRAACSARSTLRARASPAAVAAHQPLVVPLPPLALSAEAAFGITGRRTPRTTPPGHPRVRFRTSWLRPA